MLQPIDGQPKEYGQDSHSSGVLPGSGERSDTGAIPGPQVVSDNHRLDMVLKCLQNCTQSGGIYAAIFNLQTSFQLARAFSRLSSSP